jgi:hypothetical protein
MFGALNIQLTNGFLAEPGQRAGFLALAGFLCAFLFIRTSARLIRNPKVTWWPGSVKTQSGLHIHHLVWGIVTIMLASFVNFAIQPGEPWREILAVLFGIGCGLTLDEFSLWLRLEDVYWHEQGRESVDAVIVATIIGGMILAGIAPFDSATEGASIVAIAALVALNLCVVFVVVTKGKLFSAVAGAFLPVVAIVAAVRLAKPGSRWARRRYAAEGRKLDRARVRDARVAAIRMRFFNAVGGTPTAVERPGTDD